MKVQVMQTHVAGKRRTKAEMAAIDPIQGELQLYDWQVGNSSSRNLRVADLKQLAGSLERSALPKLFDATVVKITASGIHMVGFEIESVESVSTEYLQGWWAKPVG